ARRQLRDRRCNVAKASRVVAAIAADQADAVAVLVGEHPPAINLLFIDPAVAMEGLAHLRRGHRRVVGQHRESILLGSQVNRDWTENSGHRVVRTLSLVQILALRLEKEKPPGRCSGLRGSVLPVSYAADLRGNLTFEAQIEPGSGAVSTARRSSAMRTRRD